MRYKGRIVILGCGSIAQCTIPLIVELLKIPAKQIQIIDPLDKRARILSWLDQGVHYLQYAIEPSNYDHLLQKYLKAGDLLLDLSVGVDSAAMINWCHTHHVLYVNAAIEAWNKNPDWGQISLREMRNRLLLDTKQWKNKKAASALVEHGANPGLISHFVKRGIADMARAYKIPQAEALIKKKKFAELAFALDIRAIHVSERDSQVPQFEKKDEEFVNTWSCIGFVEEAIAPAELGWGSHEKSFSSLKSVFPDPSTAILKTKGCQTHIHSWVPSGSIKGMVIRHGESTSIPELLTLTEKGQVIYCPTVHYAYLPCPDAVKSINELADRKWKIHPKLRILSDEIVDGVDELGALLISGKYGTWWTGSILNIHQARRLVPHQNATTVQVAIGIASALKYAIEHPSMGLSFPDVLDSDEILNFSMPYLGKFISQKALFVPKDNPEIFFNNFIVNSKPTKELAATQG